MSSGSNGFRTALNDQFPRWLLNSFIVTGGSVVLCMLFASMAAFGLVRFEFWGRDLVLGDLGVPVVFFDGNAGEAFT